MTALNNVLYEDNVTIVTTDAYQTFFSSIVGPGIDTRQLKQLCMTIKNIGTAGAMIQILTYTRFGGLSYQELNPTTINAGSSLRYLANKFLAQFVLQAKSSVIGMPTSVQAEYTSSKI